MAFYKTVKAVKNINGKNYAVECYKTLTIFSQQTAFGRLELCLVQLYKDTPYRSIIEAHSGRVLINNCEKLGMRAFHNICICISFLAAKKIIAASKKNPKITDLPEWVEP